MIEVEEPSPAPQPSQVLPEVSPGGAATPARFTVPHVPATFTADAESLRLCGRILSQAPAGRTVIVRLFRAGETQTNRHVVSKLAAAFATQTGKSVLVIDTDWPSADRSPAAAGNAPLGLGEVLEEEIEWSDAIVEVGQPPAKVSLLNTRRQIASPVDGSRFGPLIDELQPHYRYILIDGGLVAVGSLVAEVKCCDLAYLVLGLDQTDRREAVAVAATLKNSGVDVQGCIVTYAA